MTFTEYQQLTHNTAIYGEKIAAIVPLGTKAYSLLCLSYVALGLGEAGEAQGKIKKIIRDSAGEISHESSEAIKKELGDILWYVAQTAAELQIDLSDVAQASIDKLRGRKERGTLTGSGDNR